MQGAWYPIVDRDGVEGTFSIAETDVSRVEVRLASGERLSMPRAFVVEWKRGTYRSEHAFSELLTLAPGSEIVVPVVAEELEVRKECAPRERVRVRTSVAVHDELIDLPLAKEELTVERVPVDRIVSAPSAPRQEGETWILPIYEEILHVEKRLVLREEVRVTRARHQEQEQRRVTLRREEAHVERVSVDGVPDQGSREARR